MKIDFSPENKSKNALDYPKLSLDYNERARIACVEPQPTVGWVHTIKAPQIINGEKVMQSVRQKDGSYRDEVKEDFIGRHMCFGDPTVLMEKDKDPSTCPTCAKANETDFIGPAQRAFAMHVIRYKIQTGGFTPQDPFQVELLAWRFSNKVYDTLVNIAIEHGDLRLKDLLLGPCENKMYQKFDIMTGGQCAWLASDETKALVKRLYEENKSEDLTPLIGRKASRDMAAEDVEKALYRHALANGATTPSGGAAAESPGASMDLDSLLGGGSGGGSGEAATPSPAPDAGGSASEPVASEAPIPPSEPEAAPEVTPPAAEEPKEAKKSDPLDFDDLLSGL